MIARYAYGSLFLVAGMLTTQIEDVAERRAFNERAVVEFYSGNVPVGLMLHSLDITDN
jgi:hypothetical protein